MTDSIIPCVPLRSNSHTERNKSQVWYFCCHLSSSMVFSRLCVLLIWNRATEQGLLMIFIGCKGKALCTACQITLLMVSLSGCLLSAKKERTSGEGRTILFLVTGKSFIHFFLWYLYFFSFKPCISSTSCSYSNGSNDLVAWEQDGERESSCIVGLSMDSERVLGTLLEMLC